MAKVLAYRFSENEENTIRQVAGKLGMTVRRVLREEEKDVVLQLLAKPEIRKTPVGTENPFEHFLLVAPDSEEQMFALFRQLSENGIRVPCKAMVTPTNVNWPFMELVLHVSAEAKEMQERIARQKNAKES